jgi:hypothetical protein
MITRNADGERIYEPVDPAHPSQPNADPAVQALIDDGWLEPSDRPISVAELEHAASLVRGIDGKQGAAALRARQRADRPRSYAATCEITKEYALAELRRYRDLYPGVPPEVPAFGLLRMVDQWHEVDAIRAAVHAILGEESTE